MGKYFADQYSLLHFAVGIIAYFWNIPFNVFLALHIIFEIVENTKSGVHVIDTYIKIWPGGKLKSDTVINSIGDTFFAMIGWMIAYIVTNISNILS